MRCPKCKTENVEGSAFCRKCGMALTEEKGKSKKPVKTGMIAGGIVAMVLAVGVGIVFSPGMKDGEEAVNGVEQAYGEETPAAADGQGSSEVPESSEAPEGSEEQTDEGAAEATPDPLLARLVSCGAPLYQYSGLNYLDLSLRNYAPNPKQEGMDWDSTLFYTLEDVYTDSEEDNRIAGYQVTNLVYINAQSGNPLRCTAYTNPDSMKIHKIVTVEQQAEGFLVSDYYYEDDGKPNFVFSRIVDVYIPTYATIDKTGSRYYFNNDVMVRYRRIDVPKMIVQQTLSPAAAWYPNTFYYELGEEGMDRYDAVEYQVLNEAYNVYNAVAGQAGIVELTGYVYSMEGQPMKGVSVALIEEASQEELYSCLTLEDGSYHLYVSLDAVTCCLQVYLDGYRPVYVDNMSMDASGFLGNAATNIYLARMDSAEADLKLCLYDSMALSVDEKAPALGNTQVVVRYGLNARTGETAAEGTAGEDGILEVSLQQGAYTAEYSKDGYAVTYENFFVSGETQLVRGYTVPVLADGAKSVVLSWEGDLDLDLVLYTPERSAYGNMNYISAGNPGDGYDNVLVADSVGSRCEIVNMSGKLTGIYKVYVNDYTDYQSGQYSSDALARSKARIYVFTAEGLAEVYYIDSRQQGIVWDVCDISTSITPNSVVSSYVKDYEVIDKTRLGKDAVLEMYRRFMLEGMTADFEGQQVDFTGLYDIYNNEVVEFEENKLNTPAGDFTLTDYNMDNIPELQIKPSCGGISAWQIYILEPAAGGLKITRGISGGYMDQVTLYRNGMAQSQHGLSVDLVTWFYNQWEEPIAIFKYIVGEENMDQYIAEEYEHYSEEYRYVFISGGPGTFDDPDSKLAEYWDEIENFTREYCGNEVEFYDINELSVQQHLVWN